MTYMYFDMMTTICLVNIYHLINTKKKILVMRTLRVYSLNNFHRYHSAVSATVIVLYVPSLVLMYLITGSLYL